MKKDELNKLLEYTKSKKVLRIIFLFNSEILLKEVLTIYEQLYITNRTDSQKSDLVMLYIKNRNKAKIKTLICSSLVTHNYTFQEQKNAIKKYTSNEDNFEKIINECYLRNMERKDSPEDNTEQEIKTTFLITSNKNVLSNRSNSETYNLLRIYSNNPTSGVLNIIINKNILERRNNYEQIKLLNAYIENPNKKVFDLIVNYNVLKTKKLHEQLKLIDEYLDNPSEETYNNIMSSINSEALYNGFNNDIHNKVKEEVKIYKKKKNK